MLFDRPVNDVCVYGLEIGNVVSRCITFACFAVSAVVWSSLYIFDHRIRWQFPLLLFLPGVSIFVHGCVEPALSLLLFLLVLYRLFSCTQGKDNRYTLFSAFLLFGLATMLYPPFIMLLLPFVLYVAMLSLAGVKEVLAILLGLLTPYWFLFGVDYILHDTIGTAGLFEAPLGYLKSIEFQFPSLFGSIVLLAELSVLLPFVLLFSGSASPGKPLLRKRLRFFALFEAYLLLLELLCGSDFNIYYIWSLPVTGIMLTYIYSLKNTLFSRYYFVVINIIWLLMVPFSLWLKHL